MRQLRLPGDEPSFRMLERRIFGAKSDPGYPMGQRIHRSLSVHIFLLLSILSFSARLTWAENKLFLVDRHRNKGISCNGCHEENPPGKEPSIQTCLACHGDYSSLAKSTEKLKVNPHGSHDGDLPCNLCHHSHKKSEDYCIKCHVFDYEVP